MLKTLIVKNFALIDDLKIEFYNNMQALTGETGAGKSIIMESLSLLFGKRSDADMIRHNEDKAYVLGIFEINKALSEKYSLPTIIKIEREIDRSGKHQMKLNDNLTTLSYIKTITKDIGFIHSQNDNMQIYEKSYYLNFIDELDRIKTNTLKTDYLLLRDNYLTLEKKFDNLEKEKLDAKEKADFYLFQINELKSLNLQVDEKENLTDYINKMSHYDKILQNLRESYELLDDSFINQIYDASKALSKIKNIDSSYDTLRSRLEEAFYDIDDVKQTISSYLDGLDFDEDVFLRSQERVSHIERLEQKYEKTNNELLNYLEEIESKYQLITNYDDYIKEVKQEKEKAYEKAFNKGLELRTLRQKLALKFSKDILEFIKDLDLDKASFVVLFNENDELFENGIDDIDFLISLNEGEPKKALAKVASGGERARFMFALRALDSINNNLSMLILDEIDIGISGKTASKLAKKMVDLANNMQLIVITHLPQVAAKANYHYKITKIKEQNRMVTKINLLDENERVKEIAIMLSDEEITSYAINQAKALLLK